MIDDGDSLRNTILMMISIVQVIFGLLLIILIVLYFVKLIKYKKQMKEAKASNDEEKMKESKRKIDNLHDKRNIFLVVLVILFIGSLFLGMIGPHPHYALPTNVYNNLTK